MKTKKVQGKNNKHRVLMYAISTCAWCRKAKNFLKDNDVEFEYVDVDLCSDEEREEIHRDIERRGGRSSFPTIIVDEKVLITGYHEDKMKEALRI
jgi:glutaredoxin